jgi:hypothetical protein
MYYKEVEEVDLCVVQMVLSIFLLLISLKVLA